MTRMPLVTSISANNSLFLRAKTEMERAEERRFLNYHRSAAGIVLNVSFLTAFPSLRRSSEALLGLCYNSQEPLQRKRLLAHK